MMVIINIFYIKKSYKMSNIITINLLNYLICILQPYYSSYLNYYKNLNIFIFLFFIKYYIEY